MENKKEETFTWGKLKEFVNSLNEEQLNQKVMWWGDERGGVINDAEALEDDYVDDGGGEGHICPKSEYVKAMQDEGEPIEEEPEVKVAKGTPVLFTDF